MDDCKCKRRLVPGWRTMYLLKKKAGSRVLPAFISLLTCAVALFCWRNQINIWGDLYLGLAVYIF